MMSPSLAALGALMLSLSGMHFLCLAMDRHHQQTCGSNTTLARQLVLRVFGSVILALALIWCVVAWNTTVGLALWLGLVSLGALGTACMASYVARRLMVAGNLWLVIGGYLLLHQCHQLA